MKISNKKRLELLSPRAGKLRVVMDTDAYNEIDDQFAIAQMMLSSERLSIEAIYAAPFHNYRSKSPRDGMEQSYDEILRLLDLLKIDSEGFVYRGLGEYVGPKKKYKDAPAVDNLILRARAGSPENPLYVIAIAAISNIVSAILKAPDIIDRIVVVWLGGHSLNWPHTSEFNLKQDIGGAQTLLDSGAAVVLVPCMGVTSHLHSSVPEIERYVEPQGEIGAFLAKRFKKYSDNHKGWSKEIWDMAAVAWVLSEDWAPSHIISSPILTEKATWSFDHSRHLIRYVYQIDRDAIMQDFFEKLEVFSKQYT
tara:strand:- start:4716 stop:5639 length:924 start_codon:yes stop_codon:yes gene_type:complete